MTFFPGTIQDYEEYKLTLSSWKDVFTFRVLRTAGADWSVYLAVTAQHTRNYDCFIGSLLMKRNMIMLFEKNRKTVKVVDFKMLQNVNLQIVNSV